MKKIFRKKITLAALVLVLILSVPSLQAYPPTLILSITGSENSERVSLNFSNRLIGKHKFDIPVKYFANIKGYHNIDTSGEEYKANKFLLSSDLNKKLKIYSEYSPEEPKKISKKYLNMCRLCQGVMLADESLSFMDDNAEIKTVYYLIKHKISLINSLCKYMYKEIPISVQNI